MYRERFRNFVRAVAENSQTKEDLDDTFDFINDRMSKLPQYVDTIYRMQVLTPMVYIRYEGDPEMISYKIMSMDQQRKMDHDVAMGAIAQVDRMCDRNGVEKVFGFDGLDRSRITDKIIDVVKEFCNADNLGKLREKCIEIVSENVKNVESEFER